MCVCWNFYEKFSSRWCKTNFLQPISKCSSTVKSSKKSARRQVSIFSQILNFKKYFFNNFIIKKHKKHFIQTHRRKRILRPKNQPTLFAYASAPSVTASRNLQIWTPSDNKKGAPSSFQDRKIAIARCLFVTEKKSVKN